jgi:amino acid transporter
MNIKKEHLKREISFLGLSSNIINTVIGSGIFVLPAIIAAALGAASILAYIFCGILITLYMLCVAEVASKITATGGMYIYIEKTFGKYPGFLTVCLLMLSTITGVGAIANAIVNIIFKLFPFFEGEIIRILFFVFMFSGLGYINVIGLKKGVAFVKIITIIKIAPLLLIVFIGFKDVHLTNLVWESTPTIQQIGTTSLVLYFAFTGAGTALSVSGEVRNPQKTIPRAILFSIFIIGMIYVLVQTVSQGVLGASLPSFTENPLGEVADHIFGPIGFTLLTVGAAVSMFGSISSQVLSFPRVLFAASIDHVIPIKILSKIHNKYITPHIAIIVFTILCFIFASFGGFKELAIISSAAALFISLGMSIATIKLRRNKKFDSNGKTFRIPGGYIVPILSIIVILWFLSNLSENKILGFGLLIAILTVLYFLINSKLIKRLTKNIAH